MTNREALIAEVQVSIYSETAIDKALIDVSLNGASDYTIDNQKTVALAAIRVLKGILSTKSVTEGGYSITLQVEARIADLQAENGIIIQATRPTVTSPRVW